MTDPAEIERCYFAVCGHDARFDGVFFTAVTTTGIYCRPSCPATVPKAANVRFYRCAAAAQTCGFRACKRCCPDASPASPVWTSRHDLVGRALLLVADGAVEREGVAALARRLGDSECRVRRRLCDAVGAEPRALARAQRAQTARILLEGTDLAITDVAFAAGFPSVRRCNETLGAIYALTPAELRRRRRDRRRDAPSPQRSSADPTTSAGVTVPVRLAFRPPLHAGALFDFLATRAVPGLEERTAGGAYRRALRLPHGHGVVQVHVPPPGAVHVDVDLTLEAVRDLAAALARCRRLLDLDADPVGIDSDLATDAVLAPLVAARPGLRVPASVDGTEMVVRAIVGQQVSVAGARTIIGRLVAELGPRCAVTTPGADASDATPLRCFPSAERLAELDVGSLPMPRARGRTLVGAAAAVADGRVDLSPGADPAAARASLLELSGIGPWTADYIVLRTFGLPDVFLPGDLGVRRALTTSGVAGGERDVATRAQQWAPWRSYALMHLWSASQLHSRSRDAVPRPEPRAPRRAAGRARPDPGPTPPCESA